MEILKRQEILPFVALDEASVREIVSPRNSSFKRGSLAEITIQSGMTIVPHRHRTTDEMYYVLEGAGLMQVGDEQARVVPGDAIVIPAQTRHQIWNEGQRDLIFLAICVPAYRDEDVTMLPE